ncbi:MAG: 2-polyprenylphenol 6-hydroxylase, partial [Fimbriimonadaceae bacterium]|nr:2-polyprenylphenol 6-hydroxylase [Alphaproteobacteria bacterium]
ALDVTLPAEVPPAARFALDVLKRMAGRRAAAGDATTAQRLNAALTDLGPSYIKFGQFLATRPDLVGRTRAKDLSELQDRMPFFAQHEALAAIEAAFGVPADDLFEGFGEPIAAASIAQVHKARVRDQDGTVRDVAVKILRPDIERRFANDLKSFFFAARMAERFVEPSRRLKPTAVVEVLAQSVHLEMDLRMEAAAISEMAENIAGDSGFRVPEIDWTRTTKRVLTIEWIDGIAISDIEGLRAAGHDLERLADTIIQSFLRHAMRDGFFHADIHPGNLFVDGDSNIVAVDFGIVGRLGHKERRFLAEILWGFIRRDYSRVAEVHFDAGYVPRSQKSMAFAQALRAIGEPLMDKNAEEISMARLLTQLLQVTELFDMETRPELILLQKTMVVVEGVGRTLNPSLNMWNAAEPAVREWIETNLGAEGRLQDAASGAADLGRFLGQVPGLLGRAENIAVELADMAASGIRLDQTTIDDIARARVDRDRWGRWALWIGAISLAIIALKLVL